MKFVQRLSLAFTVTLTGTLLLNTGVRAQVGARPNVQQPRPVTKTVTDTPTSKTYSSVRAEWETKQDWTVFATNVFGDTSVKDSLKQLLDSGVDVNATDKEGRTALHVAARMGQTELARYLLSRGAKVD